MVRNYSAIQEVVALNFAGSRDPVVFDDKGPRLEVMVQPWADEGAQYYVTKEAAEELRNNNPFPRYSPRMVAVFEEDYCGYFC